MKGLFKLVGLILGLLGLSSKASSKKKTEVKKVDTKIKQVKKNFRKEKKDDPSNTHNIKPKKKTRKYTYEEDKLILKTAKELGYDNPLTWKGLANTLNISRPKAV